jgi:hypothetical protein
MHLLREHIARLASITHKHAPPAAAENERGAQARRPPANYDDIEHSRPRCKGVATDVSYAPMCRGEALPIRDRSFCVVTI